MFEELFLNSFLSCVSNYKTILKNIKTLCYLMAPAANDL